MDHEKAYKSLVAKVKKAHQFAQTDSTKKVLEDILPELRESEDERIKRELIEYLKGDLDDITTDDTDRWINWIEKQKELPFVKDVMLGYPGLYFYDGERMHFRGPTMEEKQTEQKELPLMDGNADLYFDEWNQQKQNPTKRQCFEEGMRYAQRLQKEQKPVEWSDEDERHLIWLCRIIHSRVVNKELSLAEESKLGKWIDKWINHEPQPVQKWDEFDEDCLKRAIWYVKNPAPSVVKDTNLVLWLECLPKRFNLQPKQEWSEGDEKILDSLIRLYSKEYSVNAWPWANGAFTYGDVVNFLKSLRPKPHLKPSEEQMDRLFSIVAALRKDYYDDMADFLASLYEQLKKL